MEIGPDIILEYSKLVTQARQQKKKSFVFISYSIRIENLLYLKTEMSYLMSSTDSMCKETYSIVLYSLHI